jgi:hypothetical protein
VRVKLQNKLQPTARPADSVVIEDDQGNPIFVAIQFAESIMMSDINDPDFHSVLRQLGIDKTVSITELQPKPVQNVIWKP